MMILRWWLVLSTLSLLEVQGRHNDGKISNREEHSYSASYPALYPVSRVSTLDYCIATSTTHGYEASVTFSISNSVNTTSLDHNQSKMTSSGHSSSTYRSSVTVSDLPSGVSSTVDTSTASSPRTTNITKHTSKMSHSPTTGTVFNSKGSSTSDSGWSSMSSEFSGSSSEASVTRPISSSKSSVASQPVSSNRDSSTKTDTSDSAISSNIATTYTLTSAGSKSGAPSFSSNSTSSMSGSLTISKQPTVTMSIPTTGTTDSHTLESTTHHSAINSTTLATESSSIVPSSVSQSQSLKTSSVLSISVSQSSSWRDSSHTLFLTDSTSRETVSRTVSSAKPGSTAVVSSSKGTSETSFLTVSSLLGTSTKTTQSKESSADSASSQGSLTFPDSSSSKGDSAPSSLGSSSQVNSSKGSSSKSGVVSTQSASSTIITTATPGHSASTITAPPTSALTSTVLNAPSSTSTSTSIIDLLQDEIDHQVDDLKHFIVLVGTWIKAPSPNPPEVTSLVDKISFGLNILKPKLPQPPVNDPKCGTGKGKLQKRFWPFDGIKDVVNAVQAVTKVATKISKIRTQLVKGAVEGIQSELLDVGKIADALDVYEVAKDPCNAPQTTLSGIGATSKSNASKKTTSSSSACSTQTISNCDVVCTSTTISGAGVNSEHAADGCTTICGSPTVTCGEGTTLTSTTTTTILPLLVCAPTCCGLVPSGNPSPMPLISASEVNRNIQKRAPLPSPYGAPFNGIFNFMKDMCDSYSTLVQVIDNSGKITLGYQTRLDQRKSICMGWLTGCTAVVVMSNNYLWMAHIYESPTILQPNRWKEDVFDAFEFGGHGSNIPDSKSLRNLVRFGGPFGPGTRTRAYLVAPLVRRDTANHPQSNQWLYPQFVGQLQHFMERMIGNDVHLLSYMATADLEWGITNVPPTDPEHRPRWTDALLPFRTPYGKVLINFDPNKNNVPNGCWGKSGWEIWVSDGPAAVASDEWDAYNYPQPGKRAETTAPACALPSTFSTRSSSIGGTSRSSAKSTASKSSATSLGSLSDVPTVSTMVSSSFSSVKSSVSSTQRMTSSDQSSIALSDSSSKSLLTRSTTSSSSSTTLASSKPTSTAPPDISVPASGDGDCNGCGKWWKACESDWCSKINLSGKDCSDKCFVHACFADSAPSECRPDGRCHSVTCPDSPKEQRKTVRDASPIKVDCTDDTGCDCCFDFTAACFKNWIPEGTPKIRAYNFCYSEMCYDGPKKCLKGANGCEFSKDCPKKKGEPKEGGWPGTPPNAIFNNDEIEDMILYEYGLLSQNMTVSV